MRQKPCKIKAQADAKKLCLHGIGVAVYIAGQEETVGGSSVSSGCWGEDSDHKYEQARYTSTLSRLFAYLNISAAFADFIPSQFRHRDTIPSGSFVSCDLRSLALLIKAELRPRPL